jgi:tetratricopeptide (TPR) repeat protein
MRSLFSRFSGVGRRGSPSSPEALAQLLRAGTEHANNDRTQAAEIAFREVLALDRDAFDALLPLALICHQSGRIEEAIRLLDHAITVRPEHAQAHAVLALCYQATDQWSNAEVAIRKAVVCNPDWDAARNVLGVVLLHAGDAAGARSEFERALKLNEANVEALNNLANLRKEVGDLEAAVSLYRRALGIQPDWPPALVNLGLVLNQLKRFDDAESCFRAALARQPTHVDALVNLGVIQQLKSDAAAAERSFRSALAIDPNLAIAHCNLAALLLETGRATDAQTHCQAALAVTPTDPDVLNVSALLHKSRGDLTTAESLARTGLARNPRHVFLRLTLGSVLNDRGLLPEAEASFNEALTQDPDSSSARYNLGTLTLLRGDYRRGFELYESRFEAFRTATTNAHALRAILGEQQRWRGEPLAKRALLVWTEQGYGDAIMMTRYLPMLKEAGAARVTVLCELELQRLMASIPGVDAVVGHIDEAGGDTSRLHCPIMSLPHLMRTSYDDVPAPRAPRVPSELIKQWELRLTGLQFPRVGVSWKGSPKLLDDAQRSIAPELLRPLLDTGARLVSLQKAAKDALQREHLDGLLDFMPDCQDFMDTAALIENLDLVISVDTAVAHLAGTLGKPVWLLSRFQSEWRWGLTGEQSVWYPSMRIIRQRTRGDWRETLDGVAAALRQHSLNR